MNRTTNSRTAASTKQPASRTASRTASPAAGRTASRGSRQQDPEPEDAGDGEDDNGGVSRRDARNVARSSTRGGSSGGKGKFTDRLNGMRSSLAVAKKQNDVMGGEDRVPENEYVGKLTLKLKESDKTGSLMVARSFNITDGDFIGMPVYDSLIIDHERADVAIRGQRDLLNMLTILGYDNFDPEEDAEKLESLLAEITEAALLVQFQVTHSGEFTNCEILELLEDEDPKTSKGKTSDRGGRGKGKDENEEKPSRGSRSRKPQQGDNDDDGEGDDSETIEALKTFCGSWGIDFEEDDDLDTLKDRLREGSFKKEELEDAEIELLDNNDLGDLIIQPKTRGKR